MSAQKIACLGGGSLYFRKALPELLTCEDLTGSEIVLYDIDGEKVEKMAEMGRRLAEQAEEPVLADMLRLIAADEVRHAQSAPVGPPAGI